MDGRGAIVGEGGSEDRAGVEKRLARQHGAGGSTNGVAGREALAKMPLEIQHGCLKRFNNSPSSPSLTMVGSRERSFIDQSARYHASGGDLDALVEVENDGDDGVTIEDATQRGTRLYYAACYNWCSAINLSLIHI